MKNPGSRSVLGIVFLTVFLDVVGFSILFPLFPALLDHYLALEGENSAVGRLVGFLSERVGGDRDAVEALFGGVLGSLYAALQFLFAPVWGAFSDRFGRRPALLVTIAGTCLGYALWIWAGSFALLVLSRFLGGAMAGNISTAGAVVADSTSGRERAGGMGLLGMAIGLGFIVGPVLGGVFGPRELTLDASEWTKGLAVHPFSLCALVAFLLALSNLLWVVARLPETLPPERRGVTREPRSGLFVFGRLRRISHPGVLRTTLIYFLFLAAFSAAEFTLTFLAVQRLGFTIQDNTWMFVYVGLLIALVQGGLVRRLAPRLGERRLVRWGMALLVLSLVGVALVGSTWQLYAALLPMAVGSALAMPSLSSLVSRYAPSERQGLAQGVFRSMGSLSRAVGPFVGGALFWRLGSGAPFWAGAAALLVPLGLAFALPAPAAESPPEGPPPEPAGEA